MLDFAISGRIHSWVNKSVSKAKLSALVHNLVLFIFVFTEAHAEKAA